MGGWNLGLWHCTRFENLKIPLNKNIEKKNVKCPPYCSHERIDRGNVENKEKTKVVWQLRIEGLENFEHICESWFIPQENNNNNKLCP